jgi:predicted signal transduction protein with EAL and GGDEF domain
MTVEPLGSGFCQGLLDDVSSHRSGPSAAGMPELSDSTSGLPNRLGAEYALGRRLDAQARGMAILALELVPAPLPEAGSVLRQAAERIDGCLRQGTLIAHLEGARFLAVLDPLEDPQAVPLVARKLVEALEGPYRLEDGSSLRFVVRIGFTLRRPEDLDSPWTLVRRAEQELERIQGNPASPRA